VTKRGKRVVVLARASGGRGRTSGVELGPYGGGGLQVFHVRRSKVTREVTYFYRERGLAELGLAP
jgi:hypothetical protein